MIMNKYIVIALVVVSASLGYYVADKNWEEKYAEYQLTAEKQYSSLLEEKLEQERKSLTRIRELETAHFAELDTLKGSYEKTVADLLTRINRMPDCSRDKNGVSRSSGDSSEFVSVRRSELHRAVEQSMGIVTDCDKLAVKYNTLLQVF